MATHEPLTLQQPREARDVRIRAEFEQVGGSMGTNEFARHCVDSGIWESHELERIQLAGVQSEIRKALKKADATGLPFAGPTAETDGEGAPVWKQRTFWEFADYESNVRELIAQRDVLHLEALALAEECRRRYGRAPAIAGLDDRRS